MLAASAKSSFPSPLPLIDEEEEEEVDVMGGAGFTPEQLALAEAEFEKRLVSEDGGGLRSLPS